MQDGQTTEQGKIGLLSQWTVGRLSLAIKLTQKATSGEQKLNILSYNPGLKKEFHTICSNLPKAILDFAKLSVLPNHPFFYTDISTIPVTFLNSEQICC